LNRVEIDQHFIFFKFTFVEKYSQLLDKVHIVDMFLKPDFYL